MREKFENWLKEKHTGWNLARSEFYHDPTIELLWECWQGALDWDKKDINGLQMLGKYFQDYDQNQKKYIVDPIDSHYFIENPLYTES